MLDRRRNGSLDWSEFRLPLFWIYDFFVLPPLICVASSVLMWKLCVCPKHSHPTAGKLSHMKSDCLATTLVAGQSVSNGNKVLNLVDPLDVNTAKAGPPSCLSNPLLQCCFSAKDIPGVCCCTVCPHAILYIMYIICGHVKQMVG